MRESTDKLPPRSKGSKILKFLPKATSFSVPKPPYSPGRDRGHHRGFSGPIISIVPAEARRKPAGRGGYETPEPTSPKVSCIGQIKHKKKAAASRPRGPSPSRAPEKKPRFAIGRLFGGRGRRAGERAEKPPLPPARVAAPAPALGHLRRFASGRDALANFDWRASRVADESGEEDSGCFYDYEDSDDEVFIPHSAPILVGDGGGVRAGHVAVEPRKEVNLWKRRTMAPPRPLHLE
ncbi:hypothetical protein Taro_044954 [Colocasia esculenta]|uniref:Syringolide-induced protein 14-1-1 n=1 Tax=Colocasia esculenta TaxID=4460 RepID=A0A843X418_COLES|nr:hypothetical protein [Colocasia esculenta]